MNAALIVSAVIVILSVGLFILVIASRRRKLRGAPRTRIQMAWQHVCRQEHPSLKIVEADKTLDEALRLLGHTGTLGDKLKQAGPRFSDLNGLWSAHKLRNTVVHDLSSRPSDSDVQRAMAQFERALKELGM